MKKYIVLVLTFTSLWSAYAMSVVPEIPHINSDGEVEQKPSCLDLQYTLKLRSKDTNTKGEVTMLQKFLKDEGFLTVEPDGYFGSATQQALKNFQKSHNIFATGVVLSSTKKSIKYSSCHRQMRAPVTVSAVPILPADTQPVSTGTSPGKGLTQENYTQATSSRSNLGPLIVYADVVVVARYPSVPAEVAMTICKNEEASSMKKTRCLWSGSEIYVSSSTRKAEIGVHGSNDMAPLNVPVLLIEEKQNETSLHGAASVVYWKRNDFTTYENQQWCVGEKFVGHSERYGLWIGVELCNKNGSQKVASSDTYKLYASDKEDGIYYQIADTGGHGQDHCELISKNFSLVNEDEITSGTCSSCSLGEMVDVQNQPVYSRARFGEAFTKNESKYWSDLTVKSYSCGVPIGDTITKTARLQYQGNVSVSGKEVVTKTIMPGSKQSVIGTYRFTVGNNEDVLVKKFVYTIRNIDQSNFSANGVKLTNMSMKIFGKNYRVTTISSGVYSTYSVLFDEEVLLKKGESVNATLVADIGDSQGAMFDVWSDKKDFDFVGVSSKDSVPVTSSNSSSENNYYWSGYISVPKAVSYIHERVPMVLGDSVACVDIIRNLHRGDESILTKKLQVFLKEKRFLNGEVTGFYADKTVDAVSKYQRSKGLPETGMVYDFTRSAIKDETCGGI